MHRLSRSTPLTRLIFAAFVIASISAGAVTAAAATSAPDGGTVHVYLVGSLSDSGKQPLVVAGAFADAGEFIEGAPDSKVVLSHGSFVADDAQGAGHESYVFAHLAKFVDRSTCALSFSYTESVPLSRGTGAYHGITGSLKVTTTDAGVFPKLADGACNLSSNATPIGFVSIARGTGRVTFK
jgi:hypothetical protein